MEGFLEMADARRFAGASEGRTSSFAASCCSLAACPCPCRCPCPCPFSCSGACALGRGRQWFVRRTNTYVACEVTRGRKGGEEAEPRPGHVTSAGKTTTYVYCCCMYLPKGRKARLHKSMEILIVCARSLHDGFGSKAGALFIAVSRYLCPHVGGGRRRHLFRRRKHIMQQMSSAAWQVHARRARSIASSRPSEKKCTQRQKQQPISKKEKHWSTLNCPQWFPEGSPFV